MTARSRKIVLACFVYFMLLLPCLGQEPAATAPNPNPNDPVANFEYAWNRLDRNYAQFGVKNVDWDALYRVYRPQVTAATTREELWDILLGMMRHLNDEHVCLSDGNRRICAGKSDDRPPAKDFSIDLVKSKYLKEKPLVELENRFTYGWLDGGIGYLHIRDFKAGPEPTANAIDTVLKEFAEAKALVVDVRGNPGGTGRSVEVVANRFADQRRRYILVQTRYGKKHDDLGPVEHRNLEPEGQVRFLRPTVLLTNRASASAADSFALAMRVLPQVTVVGDLTEGAFSSQFPDRMPNGWTLWVAFKVATDGNGVCWDGVGVPPDLRIINAPSDIEAGTDKVLDFALRYLEKGLPSPQEHPESVADLKISLVDGYARAVKDTGLKTAIAQLEESLSGRSQTTYFSSEEAMQLSYEYLKQKQFPEAIGILMACRKHDPRFASIYTMLAQAHLGSGDAAAAEAVLKEGASVEPMYPWEEDKRAQAVLAIEKHKRGCAAELLAQKFADGGAAAADEALAEMRKKGGSGPVFDEQDFISTGYGLLKNKKIDEAVYIFEKCAALYPDSWNAHDSLAEALMKAGMKERAAAECRRSLELNPKNKNGIQMLKVLEAQEPPK